MGDRATTIAASGFLLPESPRWYDGALWFCDMLRGNVNRLQEDGWQTVASFERPAAVGFRSQTEMLVVDSNQRVLHTLEGSTITHSLDLSLLAHGRLNDMIVDTQGRAYIDDVGPDPFTHGWKPVGRVLLVEPDGTTSVVAEGILCPNGIAISPDGQVLVIGEGMGPEGQRTGARLLAFDIAPDGSLSGERVIGTVPRGAGDGLCFDREGAVWVGTSFGHEVQRFLGGQIVDRVVLADRKWALACALGGPDLRTLFICSTAPPADGDVTAFTAAWIETVDVDVPGPAIIN